MELTGKPKVTQSDASLSRFTVPSLSQLRGGVSLAIPDQAFGISCIATLVGYGCTAARISFIKRHNRRCSAAPEAVLLFGTRLAQLVYGAPGCQAPRVVKYKYKGND
jgi:hypothetical protein